MVKTWCAGQDVCLIRLSRRRSGSMWLANESNNDGPQPRSVSCTKGSSCTMLSGYGLAAHDASECSQDALIRNAIAHPSRRRLEGALRAGDYHPSVSRTSSGLPSNNPRPGSAVTQDGGSSKEERSLDFVPESNGFGRNNRRAASSLRPRQNVPLTSSSGQVLRNPSRTQEFAPRSLKERRCSRRRMHSGSMGMECDWEWHCAMEDDRSYLRCYDSQQMVSPLRSFRPLKANADDKQDASQEATRTLVAFDGWCR